MTFLNPSLALAGLACIALPILIQILMRRRRRPVAWGAMQFLLEAYRQQRRRLRFEQLLLLAVRCLLVGLIALAVGRPMLRSAAAGFSRGPTTLILVVDDSITSAATDNTQRDLDHSVALAKAALDAMDSGRGDRAALLFASGLSTGIASPSPDLDAVRSALTRVEPTDARADWAKALAAASAIIADQRALSPSFRAKVFLASAWREGSLPTDSALAQMDDATVRIVATPPASLPLGNISITDVRALRPALSITDQAGALPVRIDLARSGAGIDQPAITSVRVGPPATLDAGTATVRWNAGQTTAQTLVMCTSPPSRDGVFVAAVDSDALPADNARAIVLARLESLRIAIIDTPGTRPSRIDGFTPRDWLRLALSPTSSSALSSQQDVSVQIVDPGELLDTQENTVPIALRGVHAVCVTRPDALNTRAWRGLREAMNTGCTLMVMPPEVDTTQPGSPPWQETMREALQLPEFFESQPKDLGEGLNLIATTTAPERDDLLALLRPELTDLINGVKVRKALALRAGVQHTALLSLEDQSPLVIRLRETRTDTPLILWLAAPALSWTDLPAKPIMVPLAQELVRQSVARARSPEAGVAGIALRAPQRAVDVRATWPDGAETLRVPQQGESLRVARAGVYDARDESGRIVSTLAIAPDTRGSSTRETQQSALAGALSDLGQVTFLEDASPDSSESPARTNDRRESGWSLYLLLGAGVLALLEAWLARHFSHAKIDARTAGASGALA